MRASGIYGIRRISSDKVMHFWGSKFAVSTFLPTKTVANIHNLKFNVPQKATILCPIFQTFLALGGGPAPSLNPTQLGRYAPRGTSLK